MPPGWSKRSLTSTGLQLTARNPAAIERALPVSEVVGRREPKELMAGLHR
jgi:hypothetical protein